MNAHARLMEAVPAARRDSLPALRSALWKAYGAGALSDAEATEITNAIEARTAVKVVHSAGGKRRARFPPGVRGDRVRHRRKLAASAPMPPILAMHFTTAELAVLRVVADEWRDRGRCDRSLKELADRACVSRTTAKRALREARRLGLVSVEHRPKGRQNALPNVVHVISVEWSTWIRRGGGGQKESSLDNNILEGRQPAPGEGKRKAGHSGSTSSGDSGLWNTGLLGYGRRKTHGPNETDRPTDRGPQARR